MLIGAQKMATVKQLDKRLAKLEDWLKGFEKSTGATTTMDNMNWLVGQLRALGGRMSEMDGQMQMMNGQLEQNHAAVDEFLNENNLVMDWRIFLEKKQKETGECRSEVRNRESGCTRTNQRWRRNGRRKPRRG